MTHEQVEALGSLDDATLLVVLAKMVDRGGPQDSLEQDIVNALKRHASVDIRRAAAAAELGCGVDGTMSWSLPALANFLLPLTGLALVLALYAGFFMGLRFCYHWIFG